MLSRGQGLMSKPEPDITIRDAVVGDVVAMSNILSEIVTQWGRDRLSDPDHVRTFYIEHPDQISCVVAVSETGEVLGFQSLKRAAVGNPYDVTVGWGVIGTYAKMGKGRKGVGRALFAVTSEKARQYGVEKIDATISQTNAGAIRYYEAMGFRTYRRKSGADCKCYSSVEAST